VFARSLGEFAIAGMLHFAKQIGRMKSQQAAARWQPFEVEELHGRVLGIVGYGSIGRAAAERAASFGMRIHVLRRHAERAAQDALVERVYAAGELTGLMAASDYVLAAAPLTAETRGLIGAQAIAAMKPNAVLINLGRAARGLDSRRGAGRVRRGAAEAEAPVLEHGQCAAFAAHGRPDGDVAGRGDGAVSGELPAFCGGASAAERRR
jgi:hypothetical protein